MTIITKVGMSYTDHMNDDAPEVNTFSCECHQALSSPCFFFFLRREPGDKATAAVSCFAWGGVVEEFPYLWLIALKQREEIVV